MSSALSLMGWWFLPNLVASWTQSIYYSLTIRAGDPKPQPGTPRYARHRRTIQSLVIALYLLYTIYESFHNTRAEGTFYSALGIAPYPTPPTASEVKKRFRRLAAVHHPDKSAAGSNDGTAYMALKLASETLAGEASRFAYERFGPDVTGWKGCASRYEYVAFAMTRRVVPHYIGYAGVQYVMGLFGYLEFARYWRWFFLLAMGVFEVCVTTRPDSAVLSFVNAVLTSRVVGFPPILQFQLVALARGLCVTLYIALSQIGPLLFPKTSAPGSADQATGDKALQMQMDKIGALARDADVSVTRLLEMELAPYKGDEAMLASIRGKIKEWLVQNTIRADPMVKDAMGSSFRRRADAPHGARGNR